MTKPTLEMILTQISWWQRWEIQPGVFTPGPHDIGSMLDRLELPKSLAGARVLDIGGWNGAVSFECERRGASEVVMIEPTPVASTGFDRTKEYLDSKVRVYAASIYDLDPKWLGHFDVVLCLGVIYHLRYPLLGLDNIRRVCSRDLYVESATLETASCSASGVVVPLSEIGTGLDTVPLLQFFDEKQYFNDATNWFVPNAKAATSMLKAAGFDVIRHHVDGRYYAFARVSAGRPPIFKYAHEGIDYETHGRALLGPTAHWATMPGTE